MQSLLQVYNQKVSFLRNVYLKNLIGLKKKVFKSKEQNQN